MARPAVACSPLPARGAQARRAAWRRAGFPVFRAATAEELGRVHDRRDIGLAIIDGETDFDAALEMYEHLHGADRSIPTLMVARRAPSTSSSSASAPTTRPNTSPDPTPSMSIRWRVEAMRIRARTIDDGSGPVLANARPRCKRPRPASRRRSPCQPQGRRRQNDRGHEPGSRPPDRTAASPSCSSTRTRSPATSPTRSAWSRSRPSPTRGSRTRRCRVAWPASRPSIRAGCASRSWRPIRADRAHRPVRLADHLSGSKLGFDVLVADLHPDYGPLNRAIFARCDRILMPVTPDVPAINAAVKFLDLAEPSSVSASASRHRQPRQLRASPSPTSSARPAWRALATIRSGGPLFVRAANEGVTVVEKFPKEKVTEDFERLADRLLDRESPVAAKGGERGLLGLFTRAAGRDRAGLDPGSAVPVAGAAQTGDRAAA